MKLQQHKEFKLTSMIFWEKYFVLKFLGQRVAKMGPPKMTFFGWSQKSMHGPFLIFCMKLQQHKDFTLMQMTFFWMGEGNNLVLVQNIPKIRFFRYYVKSMHGTFLIFCMALQQHGFTTNHCIEFLLFFCMTTQQHKFWKLGKIYFD